MAASEVVQDPSPGPVILEGPGRYVVYEAPDGAWVIARAGDLCQTCTGCGCGTQADPVTIPAVAIQLAKSQGRQRLGAMLKAASGMAGRG